MSLKKGTRLTDNPKDTMFRVRLDKCTMEKLETCADKMNTTKSDVVRIGIEQLYGDIKEKR